MDRTALVGLLAGGGLVADVELVEGAVAPVERNALVWEVLDIDRRASAPLLRGGVPEATVVVVGAEGEGNEVGAAAAAAAAGGVGAGRGMVDAGVTVVEIVAGAVVDRRAEELGLMEGAKEMGEGGVGRRLGVRAGAVVWRPESGVGLASSSVREGGPGVGAV